MPTVVVYGVVLKGVILAAPAVAIANGVLWQVSHSRVAHHEVVQLHPVACPCLRHQITTVA